MSFHFISKTLSSVFIFLLLFCSCGSTPTHEKTVTASTINSDSINKIRKELHAEEKAKKLDLLFKSKVKTNGFNGNVLIAQRGQIIYENVFGYANIKTKEPLKTDSKFQLSSTSKTLTAAAILLLKDQGKLKLTDKIEDYFPEFPYRNITISLLLSHRSGLNNYVYFGEPYCDANKCYNGKTFDNNGLIQLMCAEKPTCYPPNKKFEYCNTNYALLASIVEKVSGMSFADFMDQNIFKPLGMNDTWVHNPKYDSLHSDKTIGHTAAGRSDVDTYADDVVGDKGVYSTVEDLLKWDQVLYSEKLLKKETLKEAFTGYSNEHKGKRNYGYGWRLIQTGTTTDVIYHNGWWHGYNSVLFRRPSDQTTIIILSNKDNRSIYHIDDVLAILNASGAPSGIDGAE